MYYVIYNPDKTQQNSWTKLFTYYVGDLILHIHTFHVEDRDYKCESCNKSFYYAGDLNLHIHTFHKVNKDYKCNVVM